MSNSIPEYQELMKQLIVKLGVDEEAVPEVFRLLNDLCSRLDIDLAKAFDAKEKKNQTRCWN